MDRNELKVALLSNSTKPLKDVLSCLAQRQEREREEMLAEYSAALPQLGDHYRRGGGAVFDALFIERKIEILAERLFADDMKEPLLRSDDFVGIIASYAANTAALAETEEQRKVAAESWRLDAAAAVAVRLLDEWTADEWLKALKGIMIVAAKHGIRNPAIVAGSDGTMHEVWRAAYAAADYREMMEKRNAAATDPNRQVDNIFLPLYRGAMPLANGDGALGQTPPEDLVSASFKDELDPAIEVQRRIRNQRLEREIKLVWPEPIRS